MGACYDNLIQKLFYFNVMIWAIIVLLEINSGSCYCGICNEI